MLDPGSSHGILKAIMNGIMIAHLINKSSNHPKTFIQNYYNAWINEQFYNDSSKLNELYKEFDK